MSVKIETPVSDDTCQSLDSLKTTTDAMQLCRIVVELENAKQWYSIIREAQRVFGHGKWSGQSRVKRKLESNWGRRKINVWFDVPDPSFASWISVKLAVRVVSATNK